MGFKRTVEDFVCEHCGAPNRGDGYTNHCARCLHSKHVDVAPGDRAAECQGLMVPVDVLVERGRQVLLHRCVQCGTERRCRTSAADDMEAMTAIMRDRAQRFMTGG
ncbi:MAG: RNHCP domain-containing protein [Actinomycetes bacterium]